MAGSSASYSPPFGVERRGRIWSKDVVGSSVWWGLGLLSLMRSQCSMLGLKGEEVKDHPAFIPDETYLIIAGRVLPAA